MPTLDVTMLDDATLVELGDLADNEETTVQAIIRRAVRTELDRASKTSTFALTSLESSRRPSARCRARSTGVGSPSTWTTVRRVGTVTSERCGTRVFRSRQAARRGRSARRARNDGHDVEEEGGGSGLHVDGGAEGPVPEAGEVPDEVSNVQADDPRRRCHIAET